jgi:transcriptional regulator with XRE-family HTH domain
MHSKSLADWMSERGMTIDTLLEASSLDRKVLEAILHARYTPSPAQRQRIAKALAVDAEAIIWGHTAQVQHLYGHGPQFGRTP